MGIGCFKPSSTPGNAGSPPSPRIASSARSSGDSTGFRRTAIDAGDAAAPAEVIGDWVSHVMADTDAFFTPPPTTDYTLRPAPDGDVLTFPSALDDAARGEQHGVLPVLSAAERPLDEIARERSAGAGAGRAAVLVLPQWNSDAGGHVGLCRLLAWNGMSALRLSLPYHDQRMPPELHRADYIVSANVARTVQVCRQAVLDARRAIAWLASQGYDRIGILGTSLGSCLSLLTTAHEPLIRAQALNHISPYFADVVWRGLSTRARARRARRPHRARSAAHAVEADQPARGISSGCAIGRRCSSTRATT